MEYVKGYRQGATFDGGEPRNIEEGKRQVIFERLSINCSDLVMSEPFTFTDEPLNDVDKLNALKLTDNYLFEGLDLEEDLSEASDWSIMVRPGSRQFSDRMYENEEEKEEHAAQRRNGQNGRWAEVKGIAGIAHSSLKTIGGKI